MVNQHNQAASNIREQKKEWMEMDSDIFVETAAFTEARKRLDTLDHVTIVGEAGWGKTSIGRHLLRSYRDQLRCLVIDTVSELKRQRDPKVPTLILVDDVFGKSAFSWLRFQAWMKELERFKNHPLPKTMKIIFTSRKFIFQEARPNLLAYKHSIFSQKSLVDLSSTCTNADKEQLLKVHSEKEGIHISDNDKSYIVNLEINYGFPHACCLFSKMKSWHEKPTEFFNNPIHVVVESVQELSVSDKDKFAVLLLVLFSDEDELDLAGLNEENEMARLIQDFITNRDVPVFIRNIYQLASPLFGCFLTFTGGRVSFIHQTVEDAVTYITGIRNPPLLIQHCPIDTLCDRIRLQASEEQASEQPIQSDSDRFQLVLSNNNHYDLITRFVQEIHKGNFSSIASHQACSDKEFVIKLFDKLSDTCEDRNQTLDSLFLRKDEDESFLYWSVHNVNEVLCKKILDTTKCNMDDIVDSVISCCVIGNTHALTALMQYISKGIRNCFHHLPCSTYCTKSEFSEDTFPKIKNVESILHAACYYGHVDIVKALVVMGFPVNGAEGTAESPLHTCCSGGYVEIITYLLQEGANIEAESKEYKWTPLHVCCRHGHLPALKTCLQYGADLEAKDFKNQTPLIIASRHGFLDIVKYLVQEKKVDLHAKDKDEQSAVLVACRYQHEKIVDYLQEKGVNVQDKDSRDRTVLHFACRNGFENIVKRNVDRHHPLPLELLHYTAREIYSAKEDNKLTISRLLIDREAPVNTPDENSMTPVLIAAESGYMKIIELFIQSGSELNVTDRTGQTVLHKLSKHGLSNIHDVILVKTKVDVNATDRKGQTPLHIAARWGVVDTMEWLLEKGASVNHVDARKQTPLHLAATSGKGVKLLIDAKANVNSLDNMKCTPLHLAAGGKHIDIIQTLLHANADVNAVDNHKQTPLHLAARWGDVDGVRVLVERNANIHAIDDNGKTPLHAAAENGDEATVELLLDAGADSVAVDDRQQTPLHLASACGDTESMELLLARTPIVKQLLKPMIAAVDDRKQTPLHKAAENEDSADAVWLLIKEKADVNARDDMKNTPLHLAAGRGNTGSVHLLVNQMIDTSVLNVMKKTALHLAAESEEDMTVQMLLDMGADVNALDSTKKTPLHVASANGRFFTVKILLEHGAAINAVDENRKTALHLAVQEDKISIVKLLLENKADIDALDVMKQTPLHVAAEQHKPETLKILLNYGADVHALDADNASPLAVAAENGRSENIEALRDYDF